MTFTTSIVVMVFSIGVTTGAGAGDGAGVGVGVGSGVGVTLVLFTVIDATLLTGPLITVVPSVELTATLAPAPLPVPLSEPSTVTLLPLIVTLPPALMATLFP